MRGYSRGSTPASTAGESRCRSRTFVPLEHLADALARPRRCPRRSSRAGGTRCSRTRRGRCRGGVSIPALYAARPNWNDDEPAISVRSRSKNAAPCSPAVAARRPRAGAGGCGAALSHVDDDGVALAAAGADRRAAVAAAAAAQLQHERAEDARAGGADRVAERDRAAVDVDALLVDARACAMEFSATEANASLISHRSMSPGCRPALSSAFSAALAGVRAR